MKDSEQQEATPFFTELNKALGNHIPLPYAVYTALPLATPLDFPIMCALLRTALMGYMLQPPGMAMSMGAGMHLASPMTASGGEERRGGGTLINQGVMNQGMILPVMPQGMSQGMVPPVIPQGINHGGIPSLIPPTGMPVSMMMPPMMMPSMMIPPASPPASPQTTMPPLDPRSGPPPPVMPPSRPPATPEAQPLNTESSALSPNTLIMKTLASSKKYQLKTQQVQGKRRGRSGRLDPWFVQQTSNIWMLDQMGFKAIRINDKRYACSLCSHESVSAAGCSRHATVEHTKFRYVCEHCDNQFTRPDALRRHLERKRYCKQFYQESIEREKAKEMINEDSDEAEDDTTSEQANGNTGKQSNVADRQQIDQMNDKTNVQTSMKVNEENGMQDENELNKRKNAQTGEQSTVQANDNGVLSHDQINPINDQ